MTTDAIAKAPSFRLSLGRLSLIFVVSLFVSSLVLLFAGWWLAMPFFFGWGILLLALDYLVACVVAIAWGIVGRSPLWLGCGLLMLFSCILFPPIGVLLLPAVQGARQAALKSQCSDNLHRITLALQQYHTDLGSYPPPFIADAKGKPLHSWRVLLLPYLDQKALHSQYRFDEPWDGPNNRKLHNNILEIYQCPSQENKPPNTDTNYVAVIGPRTIWPGGNSFVRDADIIDGLSNTILLVEVADSGIHWMEPRDLHVNQMPMTINAPRGQGISSHHPGGTHVAFADGDVRFFPNTTPPEILRAILTRSGKEPAALLDDLRR